MTVTVHHSAGTVTGRLDAWDESGCVIDGHRIDGSVAIVADHTEKKRRAS